MPWGAQRSPVYVGAICPGGRHLDQDNGLVWTERQITPATLIVPDRIAGRQRPTVGDHRAG